MTSSTPTKATPNPALLVFGRPTSPDLPQASWFRAEDKEAAKAAAQSLKFSVIDIQTDAEKALTVGVHEGVLKGSGRMIVGSVTPEVFRRIEDYAAKASGAASMKETNDGAAGTKPATEQNTNTSDKSAAAPSTVKTAPMAPDAWAALRVGSHVAAKYWYSDGEAIGWWIAVITAIDGNDFIIRWPDEPRTPPLKVERRHVAILHPDFDVTREWDRKR